jgi:uncharacterized protein (DUF433 family)
MYEIAPRITSNPGMFGGKPCIRNMRFRVQDVLEYLAAGETRQTLLAEFPFLEDADITAALDFAAKAVSHHVIAAE